MFSPVRRRLLPPTLVLRHLVDRTSLSTASIQLSSKKDKPDEPILNAGVSERVKEQRKVQVPFRERETVNQSDILSETFESTEHQTFELTELPKVNFQMRRKAKGSAQKVSQMKPGQLNIKMTEAAKTIAKNAGPNETEVLDDLLGKLSEDFVGVRNHVNKNVRKNTGKKGKLGKIEMQSGKGTINSQMEEDEIHSLMQDSAFSGIQSKQKFNKPRHLNNAEIDMNAIMDAVTHNETPANNTTYMTKSSGPKCKPFTSVEELLQSQPPLGIFSQDTKSESGPALKMWEKFRQTELLRATRFEPLNWFDQCIVWTEEGKLWKFPIDNEQGMDDEAKVDFTEHIFLDHHIEHWCPTEGPIRHFMELVLVGLSKNPFLKVSEKIDTLKWYEDYFSKHEELLKEINAFGSVGNPIPVEGKVSEV